MSNEPSTSSASDRAPARGTDVELYSFEEQHRLFLAFRLSSCRIKRFDGSTRVAVTVEEAGHLYFRLGQILKRVKHCKAAARAQR